MYMHVPHSVHLPVQVVDPSGMSDQALSSDQVFLLACNVGVAVGFCVVGVGGHLCVCV